MIIGAGPAGMAAAWHLARAKKDFCALEKNIEVGGLSRTYSIREGDLEFRTDNGPHRFFSKNKYLYDMIGAILQERWLLVERHTQQYLDGVFLDYPLRLGQVIKSVPLRHLVHMFFDYVIAFIRYHVFKKPITTFYDYAIANFGKRLAELNVLGYTEKVWGISCKELHPDWATQRISGLNIMSLIKDFVLGLFFRKRGTTGPKSLVDSFYYPEYGTGLIYQTMQQKLEEQGYQVSTSSFPTKLFHDGKRITRGEFSIAGETHTISFGHLIESIHITDFVKLLSPLPPQAVLDAAARLRYRSQVYLFVTLDKSQVTRNQWLYFGDRTIPFARVSEMKNFSARMSPPDKTSLFVEFFCNEEDAIYTMSAKALLAITLPHLEQFGFIKAGDVRHAYRFQGGKDYPIYDLAYRDNLKVVQEYLNGFTNLQFIGRPGRFKYTNQDHSLEMGILAARSVIEGKRLDIESVGSEKEYFEKGYLAKP